ncbi:MAG: hypothetical protein ACI4TT_00435 [Christensenellales bacterium]
MAILFAILIVVVIANILIVSFAYFSQNNTALGTIKLGELDFSLGDEGQENIKVLPSISIDKTIYVGNFRNNDSRDYKDLTTFFFRFKYVALLDDKEDKNLSQNILLNATAEYVYDNEYYYYCNKVSAGERVNLCDNISFKSLIDNEYQQKQIKLQIYVDAVQSQNDAYKEVWQGYPPEWETKIFKA